MKRLVWLLILAGMAVYCFAQQCPPADTVITDTNLCRMPGQDGGLEAYCGARDCPITMFFDHSIDVTIDDSACIVVLGMEDVAAQFEIYDSTCTYRLWDTCGTWIYPDNIQMRDTLRLPRKFRLVIIPDGQGPQAASYIQIYPRPTGRVSTPEQCDPLVVKPKAAGNTQPVYTNLNTGLEGNLPLGRGVWIRSWPDDPWRMPERIVVLE